MEVMYHRKSGERLEVYKIDVEHSVAIAYSMNMAGKQNGSGWTKVPIKYLIPAEHYSTEAKSFTSKSKLNKIKSRMKLVDAVWECEDGKRYTHDKINEAIEHQRTLMVGESFD